MVDFVQIGEKSAAPRFAPSPKMSNEPKPEQTPEIKETPSLGDVPEDQKKLEDTSAEEVKIEEPLPPTIPEKTVEPEPVSLDQPVLNKPSANKPSAVKPKEIDLNAIALKKKNEAKKKADLAIKKKIKEKSDKLLKNLQDKKKPKAKKVDTQKTDQKNPQPKKQGVKGKSLTDLLDTIDDDAGDHGVNAETVGPVLTGSEVEMIKRRLYQSWNVPIGIKGARDLNVVIKIKLDEQGYVTDAKVVDEERIKRDSAFRAAAESAQRAVWDPRVSPLPLPKEKYETWKEIEFTFNPKNMM